MKRFWLWLTSLFRGVKDLDAEVPVVLYDVVLEVSGSWVQYKREVLLDGVDLRTAATFLRMSVLGGEECFPVGPELALPGQIYIDRIDNVRDRFARFDGLWPDNESVEYCDIFAIPAGDMSRNYTHEADPNSLRSCVWLPRDCPCIRCRAFFEDQIG